MLYIININYLFILRNIFIIKIIIGIILDFYNNIHIIPILLIINSIHYNYI